MGNCDYISQLFELEPHQHVCSNERTLSLRRRYSSLNLLLFTIGKWSLSDGYLFVSSLSCLFRLKTSNKWTNNAQQNNDYRFVDVISGKLTLLMSINLRHGILLSALFVCFFVPSLLLLLYRCERCLVSCYYYHFTCFWILSTPVKFSSGKTKGIMSVKTLYVVTFGRLVCYVFFVVT